jgi:hypothetical protein
LFCLLRVLIHLLVLCYNILHLITKFQAHLIRGKDLLWSVVLSPVIFVCT